MKTKTKYSLIAAMAALTFGLFTGCSGGGGDSTSTSIDPCDVPIEASLNTQERIGGAATNVELFSVDGQEWTLFNIANELRATQVNVSKTETYGFEVEGFIQDIEIVTYDDKRYALLAMGSGGISAVNITDPASMSLLTSVKVNYEHTGIAFTDGGGTVMYDNNISSSSGPISSLAVYDDGNASTPLQLLIGDKGYGLHKTALTNLFNTAVGVGREGDGTLKIDTEAYTLQYAGENPWGGPESMKLYGKTDGAKKLFVAQGFLGMGIYDPNTLERVGYYNLYTDETGDNGGEDWFINLNVSGVVQGPDYLDVNTCMPNYNQASYEIQTVWHDKAVEISDVTAPWAAFDRYGKYYYNARKVDVVTDDANNRTIAYIAYGLAGVVAVDVSTFDTATAANLTCAPQENYIKYLGYAPAVPAHGPDESTGEDAQSLFPYFGAGMLKEAGVIDVKVDTANNNVYYSDHFAGLLVMKGALDPGQWHGDKLNTGGTYDNDIFPDEVHWPDYEFVTSYDMTPVPLGEESVPAYISESPILLKTGELSGHGNEFALAGNFTPAETGQVDVVISAGGGGLNFVDLVIVSPDNQDDNNFSIPAHFATTDEIGAAADGSATQEINIGHAAGVASYEGLLFLADGPHGMTVWQVANEECTPTDDVHVVANSLQSEYPVEVNGTTINPAPHAYKVVLDPSSNTALVMSQSRGVRRIGLSEGAVGAPVLVYPKDTDIFEHNTDGGNVEGLSMQDHAYSAALKGSLAFTADGSNGLTVYDLSKDPTVLDSGYVVGNIGGDTDITKQPPLGQASDVTLWTNVLSGKTYAFVAAGSRGVGVVDVTDAANMTLLKVFEPIKTEVHIEDDGTITYHYNKADAKSVAVKVVGDHAFFTYDSFGIVAYTIADLIKPLPDGMDPTAIWERGEIGERPVEVARFKLQDPDLFGSAELSELSGGSVGMDVVRVNGRNLFYVAYGDAGVIKIDWTNPASPVLLEHANTVGAASDVTVVNGRAYVADGAGGLVLFK